MKDSEMFHILSAVIVLFIVIAFQDFLTLNYNNIGLAVIFSFVLIIVNIAGKKFMAQRLDSRVEHRIMLFDRWGFAKNQNLKRPVPLGIILPLIISLISLGAVKFMAILSYNTSALKRRAAKRFGHMSYTEMTDNHHAMIGAAGIIFTLISSLILYFIPGLETLARLSAFYAFWNMVPFPKTDGMQIFMGSRAVWYGLGLITLLFAAYALLLI